MVHECDGGKKEVSKDGWSARFFNKIGMSVSLGSRVSLGPGGPC